MDIATLLIVYEKGIFLENDYSEIRQALIQEIKDNPNHWKLTCKNLKNNEAEFFFVYQPKMRIHNETGLNLTFLEWANILRCMYKKIIFKGWGKTNNKVNVNFYRFFCESDNWYFFIETYHPALKFYNCDSSNEIFFGSKSKPFKVNLQKRYEIYLKNQVIFACWLAIWQGGVKPNPPQAFYR